MLFNLLNIVWFGVGMFLILISFLGFLIVINNIIFRRNTHTALNAKEVSILLAVCITFALIGYDLSFHNVL